SIRSNRSLSGPCNLRCLQLSKVLVTKRSWQRDYLWANFHIQHDNRAVNDPIVNTSETKSLAVYDTTDASTSKINSVNKASSSSVTPYSNTSPLSEDEIRLAEFLKSIRNDPIVNTSETKSLAVYDTTDASTSKINSVNKASSSSVTPYSNTSPLSEDEIRLAEFLKVHRFRSYQIVVFLISIVSYLADITSDAYLVYTYYIQVSIMTFLFFNFLKSSFYLS
ncbi:XK-related protein, partial [Schistosoma japonicum]